MAKCPNCGKDVKNAKKTWKMAGKPDKKGKRTQLTIGLYELYNYFLVPLWAFQNVNHYWHVTNIEFAKSRYSTQ